MASYSSKASLSMSLDQIRASLDNNADKIRDVDLTITEVEYEG